MGALLTDPVAMTKNQFPQMLGFCAGFGIHGLISNIQFHDDVLPCICFKIFEQFVKTRMKEEYKERKSKLLLAKEEFKKLLEESKVSPR